MKARQRERKAIKRRDGRSVWRKETRHEGKEKERRKEG